MIGRVAIGLGLVFAALAALYWLVPAGSLPSFVPGFEVGSSHIHIKHGVVAAVIAVVLFVIARYFGRSRMA